MSVWQRVVATILVIGAVIAVALRLHRRQRRQQHDHARSRGGHARVVRRAASRNRWSTRSGAQRLQHTLDDEFGGEGTCFLVDGSGAQLAVHNPDTPLIGASTQKVLVAAAALSTLGPDFMYETRAVAPAAPDNGVVDQLFLVGGGDPVLGHRRVPRLPADPTPHQG